jgi:putative oxidoreductase
MLSKLKEFNGWGLLVLRVVMGVIFIVHGYPKLFGLAGTSAFFGALGIPAPYLAAVVVGLLEFGGGILLILGLFTRWLSVGFAINMLVALFLVHLKNGFSIGNGGYEFVLLLFAGAIALLFNGAGEWQLEKLFFKKEL